MTIEIMLLSGLFLGFMVGAAIAKTRLGCAVLLIVPVAMIVYIDWWQGQNPDKLTSTSALDFMFGPLWPSLGAIVGFGIGRTVRSFRKRS